MSGENSTRPFSVAVVSGKGGVGKTMVASNLAWACSQVAPTLLVDIDFHNQGCSGLFSPHFAFGPANAFESICHSPTKDRKELTRVHDNLYFLPAVSWRTRPSNQAIFDRVHAPGFEDQVQKFISGTCAGLGFEVVIFDCHGGVDPTSFSAFRSADVTLMVTEADSVTFSGTLELLTYYDERLCRPRDRGAKNIKFVVNRLPSKYRYSQLEGLYRPYFEEHFGALSKDNSVFCYIPFEQLLADGFGEYPFHLPLATDSIFSHKIKWITFELLNGRFNLHGNRALRLNKYFSERYRRKIARWVISNEQSNVNAVMNFFSWSSVTLLLLLLPWGVVSAIRAGLGEETSATIDNARGAIVGIPFVKEIAVATTLLVVLPLCWYLITALVGTMRYFRSKHLYQKRLFRLLSGPESIWRWLTLSRSFVLRWATTIGVWFLGIYGVAFLIAAAVAVAGLMS